MAGIFADEAITGTKVEKREGFQDMIQHCQSGEIDLILTKSISRFARNTLDTLQYVRMLREKNIAIIFEKENINTMDMNGELLLTIMSSLAQQEVESLSANVKLGLKMKMKRGELIGFNGCMGYDYVQEDKSIVVNRKEAETVRFMFDMYLQGYGSDTIAKQLNALGKPNKKGIVKWYGDSVVGIIKNEKYKGDLLLGKSFTTDPISKRRIANMGEEDMFYLEDHHEPIVSREVWDKARAIRLERNKQSKIGKDGTRERYTRQFALSSMCECAFCGTKLTRRSIHGGTKYKKVVWYCRTAVTKGKELCAESKFIHEPIIEGAFLEAFKLLSENFDDVLDSVMATIEDVACDDTDIKQKKKIDRDIFVTEGKRKKLTDMLLDDLISKEAYDEKYNDLVLDLHKSIDKRTILESNIGEQKNISKRMARLRKALETNEILDEFDRVVFESIVEKVIVGGFDEDGTANPYKLTFVLKGNEVGVIPDARECVSKEKE